MRLFISGSAPLLIETFERWRERTGHTILERYGMSETAMLTSNPYRPEQGERRGGTVGLPLPGVGLRVRWPTTGRRRCDAPARSAASRCGARTSSPGYWRMPEKTARGVHGRRLVQDRRRRPRRRPAATSPSSAAART